MACLVTGSVTTTELADDSLVGESFPGSEAQQINLIRITGGFLDGLILDLAHGLNCLIGARGAGKSSVLELVRYALDDLPPLNDPERQRIENLVKTNLGDGTIELTIETREGLTYQIFRRWQDESAIIGAGNVPLGKSLRTGTVFHADIYSQNQIERIAEQSLSQLSLIDHFETKRISQITAELRTLTAQLTTNATTLMPLQEQIDMFDGEIASLPGVEEKIRTLGPISGPNAPGIMKSQQARSLRQREAQALEGLWQFLREYGNRAAELNGQVAKATQQWLGRDMLAGPNKQSLADIQRMLLGGGVDIDELLRQIACGVEGLQSQLGEEGTALAEVHAEQEAAYQQLIQHDATLRGQAAEHSRLEKMKNDLLAKQHQRDALIEKQKLLRKERAQLLQQLSELRDRRYAIRAAVTQRINAALMPAIRVTLEQAGHLGEYRSLLERMLAGVRLQRNVVAQRIVERISPPELAALIRRGDAPGIAQQGNLNDEQARKVIDTLKNDDTLFALETVELADRPRIELKDGDDYKDSTCLSTGQKCTAVLPILLLDSDAPLLVDQPEDNLDNRFICESVVEAVRKVKTARQLIFVTHNPNIPVLADAERVFVLESDGTAAHKVAEGNVDGCRQWILNLLEGGELAFNRRRERYLPHPPKLPGARK